jgi:hypothetical protein
MQADVRDIPRVIATLREAPPPGGRVFSVYLDTSPDRVARQAYLLSYRDRCKLLRAGLGPEEAAAFEAAADQAEQYLTNEFRPGRPGLVLFASGYPEYFHAVALPARPAESASWSAVPELEPLQQVLDDAERVAVLLFDSERARLLTVYLGEIEARHAIEDEVPARQSTGGWFALAQTRYARHREDHIRRHAKRAVALLTEALRSHPFDRLFLAGPEEALVLLRRHLPRPLRSRLAGTLHLELFASDADVLRTALGAAERVERQEELAQVNELLDAATIPHAALGLAATLAALSEGRVHALFIADTFSGLGGACPACRRLVAGLDRCPSCGTDTTPIADLRESVLEHAVAQGARVEIVSGEAAALLSVHGGIGAWTRF